MGARVPRTSQLTKIRGRKCVADGSLMKAAEKIDFRDRKYVLPWIAYLGTMEQIRSAIQEALAGEAPPEVSTDHYCTTTLK